MLIQRRNEYRYLSQCSLFTNLTLKLEIRNIILNMFSLKIIFPRKYSPNIFWTIREIISWQVSSSPSRLREQVQVLRPVSGIGFRRIPNYTYRSRLTKRIELHNKIMLIVNEHIWNLTLKYFFFSTQNIDFAGILLTKI